MTSGAVFASRAAGVRLPPAYTLGIAMAGTLLVLAGLLFVFSRRVATPLTWPRMLLHVVQAPSVVPAPSPQRPARPVIRSSSARTIALPQPLKANVLQDLPAPAASNLDLSVGIPAPTVPLPAGIGSYPFNPYSDLNRALDAPPKAPILKNGQTLGLVGFPAIAKIAGHCYVETQLPVIGIRAGKGQRVVSRTACPGEYRPTMADELAKWAKAERKRQANSN